MSSETSDSESADLGSSTAQPDELETLLRTARSGSVDATAALLEHCRQYLLLAAERDLSAALRRKVAASDLAQQSLLDVHLNLSQFRGTSSAEFQAWLRQILAHNLANAHRDFFHTQKRQAGREQSLLHGPGDAETPIDLSANTPTPSEAARQRELIMAIDEAVMHLPEEQRQVVLGHYRDGLTFVEIGERIGKSSDAVRKIWERALDKLHDLMRPHQ